MKTSDVCILPDMSADMIGFSCGDRLELDIAIQPDGSLQWRIGGDYCSVCRRSSEVMIQWAEDKTIEGLAASLSEQCPPFPVVAADAELAAALRDRRTACVNVPWEALKGALSQWQALRPDAKCVGALACDACVHARALTWKVPDGDGEPAGVGSPNAHSRWAASDVLTIVTRLSRNVLADHDRRYARDQRFNKLDLTATEVEAMDRFLRGIATNIITTEERRISITNVFANIRKYRLTHVPEGFVSEFRRQQLSAKTKNNEAEAIRLALHRRGAKFAFVKGIATRRFYDDAVVRNFSDLDVVTPDAESALATAQLLLSERGYHLTGNGAVPFSLKIISRADGQLVLSGHLHVSRVLHGHSLVVDVAFPSLPLNLVDVLDFPATVASGDATIEELVVVATTHLLKHEIGYVKDLNDIRLLLARTEYSADQLWSLITRYRLEFSLCLACTFVLKHYQLAREERSKIEALRKRVRPSYRAVSETLLLRGWPFDGVTHQWAQAFDLLQRRTARVGLRRALGQLKATLLKEPFEADDTTESSSDLSQLLKLAPAERLYLTPLVVNTGRDADRGALFGQPITTDIFRIVDDGPIRLVLTPFGIFLPTKSWRSGESRADVESSTRRTIAKIGWNPRELTFVRDGSHIQA